MQHAPERPPRFLRFPITVHDAGPGEKPLAMEFLRESRKNKKSPRAGHPVSPGRRPRRVGSHSDPGGQAGFLLDRCVGHTPALESSIVAAHGQPRNRRTGHSMESHPPILRNTRTNSKENFAGPGDFFSTCIQVRDLRCRSKQSPSLTRRAANLPSPPQHLPMVPLSRTRQVFRELGRLTKIDFDCRLPS